MRASLRILSWNLWHGLNPYQRYRMSPMQSPREHAERSRDQIQALVAWSQTDDEIVCLQEVNPLGRRFEELGTGIGREGGACLVNSGIKVGGFGIPRGLREGLATFGGAAISNPSFEQLTLSGGALEVGDGRGDPLLTFQTGERRKALLLEGMLGDRRVAVINLHLHHGPDTVAENLSRKRAELERLRGWIESRLERWALVAVCGDFNCESDSPCLEPLKRMGFGDVMEIAGLKQPPTWDPRENAFALESARLADEPETQSWDGATHVFDRIYVRAQGPLEVTDHGIFRQPQLSDHFGVWARVGF